MENLVLPYFLGPRIVSTPHRTALALLGISYSTFLLFLVGWPVATYRPSGDDASSIYHTVSRLRLLAVKREREERVNKGMRQKRTQWSGVVRQLIKLCRWILVQLRLGRKKRLSLHYDDDDSLISGNATNKGWERKGEKVH